MGISGSGNVSPQQQRIAELAKQAPEMGFTSLNRYLDQDWLREAYRRTRKDGAVGVDGQTAADYEADLEGNLGRLLEHAKSGTYLAPPVRRAFVPKGKDELRPIGIPTFEDKVLQRAVTMLLEPIYEQDFLSCSYGFRPGRSQHQAIAQLWDNLMATGGGWVIEIDIRKFFDTLDKSVLRQLLERRVRDGVIKRLIGKWMNAGVFEGGSITYTESGTPQGGVISPLVSNVYLHCVLDHWFEHEVKSRLKGRASLVRFADDAVMVFTDEDDARKVMEVLPKRFAKYGLTLHPEKTRLLDFRRPRQRSDALTRDQRPPTFDLLGFTHYWGASRRGKWIVKRKTMRGRMDRAIKKVADWCRENRHQKVCEQHKALKQKLAGHYGYYGITGNTKCLKQFYRAVVLTWGKWLSRRSQRRRWTWERMNHVLELFPLPEPRVVHSVYGRSKTMV